MLFELLKVLWNEQYKNHSMICPSHGLQFWWHLTHWGRVTHICIGNLSIIGSDNGLSPGRRQAITWTNVGILLIGPLGTNFSEILIEIHTFLFKKVHLKMSSGKWRPFCLCLNVLMTLLICCVMKCYSLLSDSFPFPVFRQTYGSVWSWWPPVLINS